MITIYKVLCTILYPLLVIYIYSRKFIKKENPNRFKEKIFPSFFNAIERKSKLLWFHAASIGEFKSILPIINQIKKDKINYSILITTTTLSSANLAETELKKFKNVVHRFLPLDVPFLVDKFFAQWKPYRIFLVDSEIWPNLILKAKKYQIPISLINARLTLKTYNRWKLFASTAKKIFGIFNLCICSNNETKKYLESFNLKNVFFKGNIKLIDHINPDEIDNFNKKFLLEKRFWFAASTHNEEEIFCIKTHIKLKEKFGDLKTIIAPRHITRAKKIKSLAEKFNLNAQILNENESILDKKDLIIVNYFGALKDYFKFAKSVFIGKSMIRGLKNDSGQNPIEAAKLNCKIYHGPYVYNFKDIYKILEGHQISQKVENFDELSNNLTIDLKHPHKDIKKISDPIIHLGNKTLSDTMRLVDNFLLNDVN